MASKTEGWGGREHLFRWACLFGEIWYMHDKHRRLQTDLFHGCVRMTGTSSRFYECFCVVDFHIQILKHRIYYIQVESMQEICDFVQGKSQKLDVKHREVNHK